MKFENGNFYSTIPNMKEILENEEKIFNNKSEYIEGINLNKNYQLQLLDKFSEYYNEKEIIDYLKENNIDANLIKEYKESVKR